MDVRGGDEDAGWFYGFRVALRLVIPRPDEDPVTGAGVVDRVLDAAELPRDPVPATDSQHPGAGGRGAKRKDSQDHKKYEHQARPLHKPSSRDRFCHRLDRRNIHVWGGEGAGSAPAVRATAIL